MHFSFNCPSFLFVAGFGLSVQLLLRRCLKKMSSNVLNPEVCDASTLLSINSTKAEQSYWCRSHKNPSRLCRFASLHQIHPNKKSLKTSCARKDFFHRKRTEFKARLECKFLHSTYPPMCISLALFFRPVNLHSSSASRFFGSVCEAKNLLLQHKTLGHGQCKTNNQGTCVSA